ncbi:MAG: leucine-rich repeat protein [Clostridia bacterium]|nr:leucine-rich repeat protein [Clostridia bacterium]
MKKTSKIISLLLCLAVVFSCVAVTAFAQGEAYLVINKSGSGFVVDSCSASATGEINIPATYEKNGESLPVKGIADNAFQNCSGITKVTIPASVTTIGKYAFADCGSLQYVSFSGSTCSIGKSAFNGCNSLISAILPDELSIIPEEMFKSCVSLSEISIPSTVAVIGKEAFMNSGLTHATIPASTISIGQNTFMSCGEMQYFDVDSANTTYTEIDDCIYTADGATLVQYPTGKSDASYTVPAGTIRIGNGAFASNGSLRKVYMPSSLTVIEAYAFYNCALLEEAAIPSGVTAIGSMAFAKCPNLRNVVIPSSVASYENAFVASGLESVVIENGVETISPKAFKDCKSLASVTIPSSVTTIGVGAFDGCTALEVLSVPSTVKSIGNGAFIGCSNITLYVEDGSAAYNYAVANSIKTSFSTPPVVKVVSAISIKTLPSKLTYKTGEKINTAGLVLNVIYSDGSVGTVANGYSISPSSFSEEGTKSVTVTYSGKTTQFDVTVSNSAVTDPTGKTVISVQIAQYPTKLQYNYKESVDTTGLILQVNYADGTSERITSGFLVKAPAELKPVGQHTVTVVYGEFSDTFTVTASYAWWQWLIRILLLGFLWY